MLFICKGMVRFLELRCLCPLTSLTLHKDIIKKAVVRCGKQIEVDNYDEIRTCNLLYHALVLHVPVYFFYTGAIRA